MSIIVGGERMYAKQFDELTRDLQEKKNVRAKALSFRINTGCSIMTEFNNSTMRSPRHGKPHIAFINGWWRVSPLPKPYGYQPSHPWRKAYNFINQLNDNRKPGK